MLKRCKIAVFTSGRQDYGILRSTLLLLREEPGFDVCLIAGGMHLSTAYGLTICHVEEDGFLVAEKLDWLRELSADSITQEASLALDQVGAAIDRQNPNCLMLVGDRYETVSAALAATLRRIPIIHLHGGEETEGAFDNSLRHAITKLSHLHLVSHPTYAARVIQMGEDPSAVHVVGAPGLDNLFRTDLPDRAELEARLGLPLHSPVVVITIHPTTLSADPLAEVDAVEAAVTKNSASYVITLPNCDPGNELIRERLKSLAARQPSTVVTEALGERLYTGLLRIADAMVGNSSSGLIDAAGCGLPVVNVGDRQKGRVLGKNVISVSSSGTEVEEALNRAIGKEFRRVAKTDIPLLCDGKVGQRVVAILRDWRPPNPARKSFFPFSTAVQLTCEPN